MDQYRLIRFDQEWSSHLWAIPLVPWLDKVQDSSTGRERAYEMLNRLYCDFTATRGEKNQRKKMAQKVGAQGASAEDACMAGANSPVFISSLRPLTLLACGLAQHQWELKAPVLKMPVSRHELAVLMLPKPVDLSVRGSACRCACQKKQNSGATLMALFTRISRLL